MRNLLAVLVSSLVCACGGGTEPSPAIDAGSTAARDAGFPDAGSEPADASAAGEDAAVPPAPSIDEVLRDCTRSGTAGVTERGPDLARIDVDLARFPDARCVDGTGAVFYVRRASDPASDGRWVIQLQGGGSCSSGELCAERWCRVDTNFGADKMSSRFAPDRTSGDGILAARPDNPFADWNQVFVHYCSSDVWTGRRDAAELDATHPVSGEPVRFTAHFEGASILDAVIDTLRREGSGPVSYEEAPGVSRELPDLDEAVEVVLAGSSAGGNGVVFALDRVSATLREENTGCREGACRLETWGIVDSAYPVGIERYDFSTSVLCPDVACTWQDYMADDYATRSETWAAELDDTCEAWHLARGTGEVARCIDQNFVIENHLTTPFVLRMGLTDSHVGANAAERGFTVPERDGAVLTLPLFAELVAEQMSSLAALESSALERERITRAPGVFGPRCPKHETLSSTPNTYDVTITGGGSSVTFPSLIASWRAGRPAVAISSPGGATTCP